MKKKVVGFVFCLMLITTSSTSVICVQHENMSDLTRISVDYQKDICSSGIVKFEDVEIIRDGYGVPHVYADTRDDLAFGMGYAIAEDRLWQLDLIRRQSTGRLAEFGLAAVEDDLFIRTIGQSEKEATSLFNNLSASAQDMYIAFVAGVNQYIDEALADPDNKMPAEYVEYDLLPEYLTIEDLVITGIMAMRLWGEAGAGEELYFLIFLVDIIKQNGFLNGWKIFNDLFPIFDGNAATTLNSTGGNSSQSVFKLPLFYSPFVIRLAKKIIDTEESFGQRSASLGLMHHFGSNAWVVGPDKSASGNTLLLGGPQMGHSIPQQVVEVGLHGSDIDVVGITIPALGPILVIGVSQWCSWSQTTGYSDLVDTYIERLHPFNKEKYRFNGGWVDMEKRTESIVDSSGIAQNHTIYRTVHGSVLGSFWIPVLGGLAITRKEPDWTKANDTLDAVLNFPICKNVSEFADTVSYIPTSHNYLVADRYGSIGYVHTGWYPIRPEKGILGRKLDPRLPLCGSGREEWQGILPFEENPQEINSEDGFYANWNNKPSSDWTYFEGSPVWYEGSWGDNVRRIQELLASDGSITVEDMKNICEMVACHLTTATAFKPFLMNAIENVGGIDPEIVAALEEWDCYLHDVDHDECYDFPGVTIFNEWLYVVYQKVLADEIPATIDERLSRPLLLHIFQGENSSVELRYTTYLNDSADSIIVSALEDALLTLESRYGTTNISEWLEPVWMLTETDPIFTEL